MVNKMQTRPDAYSAYSALPTDSQFCSFTTFIFAADVRFKTQSPFITLHVPSLSVRDFISHSLQHSLHDICFSLVGKVACFIVTNNE